MEGSDPLSSSPEHETLSGLSVSIIVCTFNRANSLRRTLQALGRMRIPAGWKVEVVLVDNASTDDTAALVRSTVFPNMEMRYVYEARQGLSHARNAGLASARGEFILFTDDDGVPSEEWLERMGTALANSTSDAVTGYFAPAESLMRHWLTPVHKWWLGDSDSARTREGVRELIGGNMGFRRAVLERVPAFDSELGAGALGFAEEALFGWQLVEAGFRIQYVRAASVIHHLDESRLRRADWLDGARKRGRTEAYLSYHWEHADITFPRLKGLWYGTKLWIRRLLQPPPGLYEEGCQLWEMSYVHQMEKARHFRLEQKRPRHYSRRGLIKRVSQ